MLKFTEDVAGNHIGPCDVNYWSINTLLYTAAITLMEHLGKICSTHDNESTKPKQPG